MNTLTESHGRIKELLDICKKLYQLCSMILYHLSRYEDVERYDSMLLEITNDVSKFHFSEDQDSKDPTIV